MRQVALLRGINLGKNKRVAMADLRALVNDLGYEDVVTHLQSGNIVYDTRHTPAAAAKKIGQAVSDRCGFPVTVIVRTGAEMVKIVAANPLPDAVGNGSFFHVMFLSGKPSTVALREVQEFDIGGDDYRVLGREIYVSVPNGTQNAKVFRALTEQRLGVSATMRTWNVVRKLAELAAR